MITRIEVENFKCLKNVKIDTKDFQLLIGPNGSGKSTFMDVMLFLQDLTRSGLLDAIHKNSDDDKTIGRARNVTELFSDIYDKEISISLFIQLPTTSNKIFHSCQYKIVISIDEEFNNTLYIKEEQLVLFSNDNKKHPKSDSDSLVLYKRDRKVMTFLPNYEKIKFDLFDINRTVICDYPMYFMSVLRNYDNNTFKKVELELVMFVLTWLHDYLVASIRKIELKDHLLRNPVPIGFDKRFSHNTPNLTTIIESMTNENKQRWVDHVQCIYPDIKNILVNNDRLSAIKYYFYTSLDEKKIMSWQMSSGTVRLLALTSLAYFDTNYCYLIEEPENGLHPTAIQDIVDSLKSIHKGQVFIASHSPIILSCVSLNDIFCFSREDTYTKIVPGQKKSYLKNWKADVTIGDLFVKGLLNN